MFIRSKTTFSDYHKLYTYYGYNVLASYKVTYKFYISTGIFRTNILLLKHELNKTYFTNFLYVNIRVKLKGAEELNSPIKHLSESYKYPRSLRILNGCDAAKNYYFCYFRIEPDSR